MTGGVLRELVLPRLEGVKKSAAGFMARCPAHEDSRASLSVSPGKDQPVLFHCHAGCDPDTIVGKLGLTWEDLSKPRERREEPGEWTPAGPAVAVYDYRDENGNLLFQVCRTASKDFRQRVPDPTAKSGWTWRLGDTRRVLYRLPEVLAAVREGREIWLCFADDTEVLTPTGWQMLAKLPSEAKVAQYDSESGSVAFVAPIARQQFAYAGEMVNMAANWCAVSVTPDHRMLTRWEKTAPVVVRAGQIGQQRWLPVAGRREGVGVSPTPAQARVLAAWQADGVNCVRGFRVAWNIRKGRKKDRLRHLFREAGIEWREQEFDSTKGWTYFTVDRRQAAWLDKFLPDKRFHWGMLDWSILAREVLLDEIGFWDGDRPGREGIRFFTADEQCAEVVSALAATSGYGATVRVDDREGRPEQGRQWVVNLVPRDWRTLGNAPTRTGYDGIVYCLTVPSGFLVTRRQGKVTVAGNCEGEKDVHTLLGQGLVATCNPGGAGKWRPEFTEVLREAVVVIVADRDEPGQAHARQVAKALTGVADHIRVVEAATGKDVTDHINAGYTISDLAQVWASEEPRKPDLAPDLWEFIRTEDEPYDWIVPGLLERMDRLMLTGFEGLGKSIVLRQMAVCIAAGLDPFTFEEIEPHRVLLIDCENSERQSRRKYRPLAAASIKYQRRVPDGGLRLIHRPEGVDLTRDEDAAWLQERVSVHQPDVLFIGPFYRLHAANLNEELPARKTIAVLDQARVKANCALVIEAHAGHGETSLKTRAVRPTGSSLLLRWPEFGFGLRPATDENPCRLVDVVPWRGARDQRDWPEALAWNPRPDDWPWVVAPGTGSFGTDL